MKDTRDISIEEAVNLQADLYYDCFVAPFEDAQNNNTMKVPRKLKKAAKHIIRNIQNNPPQISLESASQTFSTFYTIENGYPYTKWVRKAIGKARYGVEMAWKAMQNYDFWKEHYYGGMIPKQ